MAMNELENLEDFTFFLLLHMGHVDGSLHPNEKDTILEGMKEIFPSHSTLTEKFVELDAVYKRLGPGRAEDLLNISLPRFANIDPIKKKEIYSALFDIINANGRVNEEETQTLSVFKSWLTS